MSNTKNNSDTIPSISKFVARLKKHEQAIKENEQSVLNESVKNKVNSDDISFSIPYDELDDCEKNRMTEIKLHKNKESNPFIDWFWMYVISLIVIGLLIWLDELFTK